MVNYEDIFFLNSTTKVQVKYMKLLPKSPSDYCALLMVGFQIFEPIILNKPIPRIALHLGNIFFDFLLLVFFTNQQYIIGINNNEILQAL